MIILQDKRLDIYSPERAASLLQGWLREQDEVDQAKEHAIVLILNIRMRLILADVVSVGILDASLFHPREVFRRAVLHGAASIILAHNHPSTLCDPSSEDRRCTERLMEAGRVLGISVVDHLVFSTESYCSLSEQGLI